MEGDLAVCPWDGTPLGTVVMDPLLGVALGGRYVLMECMEARGVFRVYSAREQGSERALLVTLTARQVSPQDFVAFRELAEGLTRLDHPSCMRIHDFGLADEILYLVEEGDVWHLLSQELEVKGRLPASMALDLQIQLLEGLDYLHGHGIVHGQLLPTSLRLIFDDEGALKLRIPASDIPRRVVQPESDPQTQRYYPTEDATPFNELRGDVHAATRIMVEMLTGDPTGSLQDVSVDPDHIVQLENVVARGLGQDPHPYRTAGEMLRELQSLTGRSRFGRYELLRQIGQGGMGEIYLARAEGIEGMDLDRLCVIKTIQTSLASDPNFVERFLAEARVLASLSHGNIVPVYDVGKVGTTFYIAMQYVAGKDVRQILKRAHDAGKRLPVPLGLFIARELANGLAYAHRARVKGRQGLVHRDVSPHNVLVSYEGEVRLIDFGLAQRATRDPATEGVVMGKVCYMSPEQALAQPLDQRTDIYSAGLVLFELLVGEPFFNQPSVQEVMAQIGSPSIHPPSSRTDGIPAGVDHICLKAMALDRAERYASAADLRDDLAAELARLAPRTNPEEVGAFVRSLFTTEQVAERQALSDLSATLPPLQLAGAPSSDAPSSDTEPAREQTGEAVSLLRGETPIQLTGTGLPLRPLPSATLQLPVIPEPQGRGLLIAAAAVLVLVAIGLLVATSWRRTPRHAALSVAVVTEDAGPVAEIPADDLTRPADAAMDAARRRPGRPGRGSRPGPRPCLLDVTSGPAGAEVVVNDRVVGRLPLDEPVALPSGIPLRILIQRKGTRPFRYALTCRPGERVRVTAGLRSVPR